MDVGGVKEGPGSHEFSARKSLKVITKLCSDPNIQSRIDLPPKRQSGCSASGLSCLLHGG